MSRFIYALKLNQGKWYVGKSKYVYKRIENHALGRGAAFTKLFGVDSVSEIKEMKTIFDEDNLVKTYMLEYGIENVRGGAYSQINLDQKTIDFLRRELNHVQDACFLCGSLDHFISQCNRK